MAGFSNCIPSPRFATRTEILYPGPLTNLPPVVELPQTVFSAETLLRDKADMQKYSDNTPAPAFILQEGRLWRFASLRESRQPFGRTVRQGTVKKK